DPGHRRDQYAEPTFYRLVNYEQVVRDRDAINAWKPDVIVLDEAQRIKNWESKTSKEVKKLKSRYAMVLTGTPLENRLEELYSIVQFVDERRFGPAFQFLYEHRVLDEHGNLKGYRNLDKIRERLAPIFLRRTRADVLGQLPDRTDKTVFVELAPEQRVLYDEQLRALVRLITKPYLTDVDRKRILSCLANLRMVCDSTYLLDKQTNVSPKLDEFAELVAELLTDPAHKAVVFSQWETMLQKAAERLDGLGVGHTLLHGRIPGKDRKALIDRFHSDPTCRVFLSTDAGGTGLNLQTADTVINLEVPWNPAVLEQRIARVHRMGQSRPVRVVHLLARDTIEERVLKAIERKTALFAGLFAGDADEVDFAAVGTLTFLETVRDLVEEQPSAVAPTAEDARAKLAAAGVQFLEALAAVIASEKHAIPPELASRGTAALRTILQALDQKNANGQDEVRS
ncbi:MAG TPA: DEAD/DEAH box helicase, partial [Gemmataceae bacterium]|nr:DEAD/DEAH box helicase [Gemmataceae bacterium]